MVWPFALLVAADRMNNLHIDLHGLTPEMKFSKTTGESTRLSNFHTFGCPVYVLDARLQDAGGAGAPKWDPRSRLGIYVGHSPQHAGSVALVLNPKTGLISPQFHVIFDDDFSTVPSLREGTVPANWNQLVQNSRQKSFDGFYDVTKTWFDGIDDPTSGDQPQIPPVIDSSTSADTDSGFHLSNEPGSAGPLPSEGGPGSIPSEGEPSTINNGASIHDHSTAFDPIPSTEDNDATTEDHSTAFDTISFGEDSSMPPIVDFATAGLHRSTRERKKPDWFTYFRIILY